jgi:hypothetical protein
MVLNAQIIRNSDELKKDTLSTSAVNLLEPTTHFYNEEIYNNFDIASDRLKLNSPSKFLLKLGAGILRGTQTNWEGDIPLYSYENAWKYPGKTIRYPESLSKYKGFLHRYDQYNAGSQ